MEYYAYAVGKDSISARNDVQLSALVSAGYFLRFRVLRIPLSHPACCSAGEKERGSCKRILAHLQLPRQGRQTAVVACLPFCFGLFQLGEGGFQRVGRCAEFFQPGALTLHHGGGGFGDKPFV